MKTNSSEDLTKSTGMDYNKTLRGESSITNSDKGRNIDKIADSSSLVSMKKVVYDNYKSQNYQKKRKKKLIKHCADDPEEEDEVEEEEDKAPEEFYLYKFKTEEELIRTYLERYNYNLLRIAKCHSFTKTSKRELNINESAKITDVFFLTLELLRTM